MRANLNIFLIIILLGLFSGISYADIFKCVDESGKVTYHTTQSGQKSCNQLDLETDEEKQVRAKEIKDFPKIGMKVYDDKMLCINYGQALRKERKTVFLNEKEDLNLMRKELRKRNLKIEDSIIKEEEIKLGLSTCSLYASWGAPINENESVGTWGVHVQHVYGNNYVYTENGTITSWQK